MRRCLHLHDAPQVSKLSRNVSNQIILAQVATENKKMLSDKIQEFQQQKMVGHMTYSLKRCSKLPIDEGIEPEIMLQDKSLKIYIHASRHSIKNTCLRTITN